MSTCRVVLQAGLNAFECFFFNLFLSLAVAESVMHMIRAVLLHYTIVVADCPRLFDKLMLCKGFLVLHNSIPGYATTWSSTLSLMFKQFENETLETMRSRRTGGYAASVCVCTVALILPFAIAI
ncbi:hypothetical protein PF011_g19471 [Phytophthora fragariae]|uniref:Uncharacterized protein n=1 Tax=Phytophthora fragariae TaxID=53985 RepID=A0A6A3IX66_9STRA|nr:hypothetical protein PF011_g19471 [Phytophthora fragariae]